MGRGVSFDLYTTTKGTLPQLPFLSMKEQILGKNYTLTLVFVGDKKSRTLNRTHRGKDYPTNILSFPITRTVGEIYISLPRVRVDAKKFDLSERDFVGFLFIHGLLHLKGHTHGSTMEKLERKWTRAFSIPDPYR